MSTINAKFSDFFSRTESENEYIVNYVAGFICLLSIFVTFLIWILNLTGVFVVNVQGSLYVALANLPISLPAFIICSLLKIKKSWVKYVVVLSEILGVALFSACYSYHASLLWIYPILTSCLYFKSKFVARMGSINILTMFVSHFLMVNICIVSDDPLVGENVIAEKGYGYPQLLTRSLLYGFVPKLIIFLLLFTTIMLLMRQARKAVEAGYARARAIEELNKKQKDLHFEVIKNLATIAENKSQENGEHINRVFHYMRVLAKEFGYSNEDAYNIGIASLMHDIGKLGVDEKILSKPGRLTPDEFEIVKTHSEYGKNLLSSSENGVMKLAQTIAYEHHERWDGNGYHNMKGEEIDQISCMMAVVDVFDALSSKRCYKEPWSFEDSFNEIVKNSGTQFSPIVVDKFIQCKEKFYNIYTRYSSGLENPKQDTEIENKN